MFVCLSPVFFKCLRVCVFVCVFYSVCLCAKGLSGGEPQTTNKITLVNGKRLTKAAHDQEEECSRAVSACLYLVKPELGI